MSINPSGTTIPSEVPVPLVWGKILTFSWADNQVRAITPAGRARLRSAGRTDKARD